MNDDFLVLLAEDDEAAANLIQMNLKRAGVKRIHWAKNGQEAVDYLKKHLIMEEADNVLFLLDIKMPVLDGFETLKYVKGNAEMRKVPIIMLTTTDNPFEVEKCYSLGCNFYIKKPVEYKKFVVTIKSVVDFAKLGILPEV